MPGFVKTIRRGFKPVAPGFGGGGLGFGFHTGRPAGLNYHREAGVRYDNSIVYAAAKFAIDEILAVDVVHERPTSDGAWEEVPKSPIIELLLNPNPWYSYATMISGWVTSELTGIQGQSYTFKHRSSGRRVVGLEYLSHFSVWPFVTPGSGNFLEYYRLTKALSPQRVEPEDMLVQRWGIINPIRPQVSIGPLEAALLEVVTDKEAANYTASLLLNGGVTSMMISPALKDSEGTELIFGPDQIAQVKATFDDKITGDNRNRPLVSPIPVKVDQIGMKPADMNMDGIRNVNEERVCAVLRIPPQVLHLGTGLKNQNNRASAEAAARAAGQSFVKPYMVRKGMEITRDLIPELGQPGERIRWKHEDIESLQENKTEEAKRGEISVGGAYLTVNEYRESKGFDPIEGGDEIRQPAGKDDEDDNNPRDEDKDDSQDS